MFMVVLFTLLTFSFAVDCYPSDCVLPFPRSYVVYHLKEQEGIRVDGKVDEEAWDSVSWTEDFIGKLSGRGYHSFPYLKLPLDINLKLHEVKLRLA